VRALVGELGIASLTVADRPGALCASLLLPYLNDAARMYEARYASREDIDAAMRFGCGHPRGPLGLLDELGLDVVHGALEALHALTGDHLHAPAPLLTQLVSVGWTGIAAGRGIYSYDEAGSVVADELTPTGSAVAAAPRAVRSVGVIGTGTMASGIIEVCARSGYDVVFRARSEDKVAGVRKAVEASLDKAVRRGKLDHEARDETIARVTARPSWPPWPTATWSSRRWWRTWRSSRSCSPSSTGSASRGRSCRRRPRRCRWSRSVGSPRGRPTSSGCTGSTRRR
jgi:3-hydroxybutyryl-CoA dehydrogenase